MPKQQGQISINFPSRRRQSDNCTDIDNISRLKKARLTRRNLARFNKLNQQKGKQLEDSRNCYEESAGQSRSTRTFSTTKSGFAIRAYDNGLLPPDCSEPPTNLEELRRRFASACESASPTREDYEDYVENAETAANEASVAANGIQHLLKNHGQKGYIRKFDVPFTGIPKDVGFNNGLSAPQPGFVEGLVTRQYRPLRLCKHISGAAIQEEWQKSAALPHISGKWKGRGRSVDVAELQAGYTGAALVYSRNQALAHMGKSDPPRHAEVTTFTTDGTHLTQ